MSIFHKYPYSNFHELNLDWILQKITEFDSKLEEWSVLAEELKTALKDIPAMQADISTLQAKVSALEVLKSDVDTLSALVNSHDRDLAQIKEQINSIDLQFNAVYAALDSEVTLLNQKLKSMSYDLQNDYNSKFYAVFRTLERIMQILNEINTSVLNPWHQELNRVGPDTNARLIYNDLADECPTAEDYLKLGLTADEYKNFDISAINYARFGKIKLHSYWVYMPVEGVKQEVSNVLCSLADHVFDTYSAYDYAALDLTADDYAALNYSAYDYLKANYGGGGGGGDTRNFIKFDMSNSGLTRTQYEHLGVSPT